MQLRLSKLRGVIQAAFFIAFIALLVAGIMEVALPLPTQLFLAMDPLIALIALIAGLPVAVTLLYSLITIALTLMFGRVFCGYMCPMGTLIDWAAPLAGIVKIKQKSFRALKVVPLIVLTIVLVSIVFGNGLVMILDPISILTRTATATIELINVAANFISTEYASLTSDSDLAFGTGHTGFGNGQGLGGGRRGAMLDMNAPRLLESSGWIFGFFAIVIAMNLLGKRFWCRYLCPLGGLLGLLARVPLFRRKVDPALCTSCMKCSKGCDMDAVTNKGLATDPASCSLCLKCRDNCLENAISWGLKPELTNEIPSRRTALTVIGGSIVAASLAPLASQASNKSSTLVRPPGVSNEDMFLQKCVRCGECMAKCPTKVLQPSLLQYGVESLWTPHADFSAAVCDYGCNKCGEVCPTGAIEYLTLEQKQVFVMGIAELDYKKCIRLLTGFGCGICIRPCPAGAIGQEILRDETGTTGMPIYVDEKKCIGCGICEAICPVRGTKAIRVVRKKVGTKAEKPDANREELSERSMYR